MEGKKPKFFIKYKKEDEVLPEKRKLAQKVLKFARCFFNYNHEIKILWFERASPDFFELDQALGKVEELVLGENKAKTDWFPSTGFYGAWRIFKERDSILIDANLDEEGVIWVVLHEAIHLIFRLLNEEAVDRITQKNFEACKKFVLADKKNT